MEVVVKKTAKTAGAAEAMFRGYSGQVVWGLGAQQSSFRVIRFQETTGIQKDQELDQRSSFPLPNENPNLAHRS